MPKTAELIEKKQLMTIQFKVSEEEYSDIQKAKANTNKSRMLNQEYYRELMFNGLKAEMEKI